MEHSEAGDVVKLQSLSKGSAASTSRRSKSGGKRRSTLKGLLLGVVDVKPPTSLADVDASVLAEQLTLLTREHYERIHPRECLKQAWKDEERKHERAANVSKSVSHSNALAQWVKRSVVAAGNGRDRGKIIRQWVNVEERLFALNNFHELMMVHGGLETQVVFRLKKAWDNAGKACKEKHGRLKELLSSSKNYSNLRSAQLEAHDPMIPYFGLFAQDMILKEQMHTKLPKLDWNSLWTLKSTIYEFLSHQRSKYNLD